MIYLLDARCTPLLEVHLTSFLPDPEVVFGYYPVSDRLPGRINKENHIRHPVEFIQCPYGISGGRHMLQEMTDESGSEGVIRKRDMGNTANYGTRMTINRAAVDIKANVTAAMSRLVKPAAGRFDTPRTGDYEHRFSPLSSTIIGCPVFPVLVLNFKHPHNKLPDTYSYQYR
jgi:hypothetical protein